MQRISLRQRTSASLAVPKLSAVFLTAALCAPLPAAAFSWPGMKTSEGLTYSEFVKESKSGFVKSVDVSGSDVRGTFDDGNTFFVTLPQGVKITDVVDPEHVEIIARPEGEGSGVMGFFSGIGGFILPVILIVGILWFVGRRNKQQQKGGPAANGNSPTGAATAMGKSKAKVFAPEECTTRFSDVAGIDEAKGELIEMVDFLKNPAHYTRLGAKIPHGALLVGPPGTGKTLMAKAIAGEAGVPFFAVSGSEFIEMYVGVGAARVRDLFEQAKKQSPCIIFIDEIDAIGKARSNGMGGGGQESDSTLNQLLVEMNGFEGNTGIIVLAATNRVDILDAALTRPGRFDRQIHVGLPDLSGRVQILKTHMRGVPLDVDVDPAVIARGVPGFSGADLANLVNEAALTAARRKGNVVKASDFEKSRDRVMMGAERKSLLMSEKEKKLTAYHEAGHALVALHSPGADPIHKATIIPRGGALGMVMQLPEGDRVSMSRQQAYARLAVLMGGRVAEERIFGRDHVTSGASSDINAATDLAERMVQDWGLSDKAGVVRYAAGRGEQMMGVAGRSKNMAEQTSLMLDQEIRDLVDGGYNAADMILAERADELERIAQALITYETLTGAEIAAVARGEILTRAPEEAAVVEVAAPFVPKPDVRPVLPKAKPAPKPDDPWMG